MFDMNSELLLDIAWRILAVAALVFLNGFFVAAEFALVKVRDTQLDTFIARGSKRAKVARRVLKNLDAALSACQLGITLASLGLGWAGEPVFSVLLAPLMDALQVGAEWRHKLAFLVGFSTITFLHITAGEQAPKWLAIQKPLPTMFFVASPLVWFQKISWPFIWVLNHFSQWLLRQAGLKPVSEMEYAHSEDELRLLISSARRGAIADSFGRNIVLNAFDLPHRMVREVMRPRLEIVGLDTDATIAECIEVAEKTRYSRFPLLENGNIDRALGVVHIKDLYALRKTASTGRDLLPVARKVIYVPPTAKLEKLLNLLLEHRLHMALVVDEYGGTMGMVTLENILEELVGQIQDEFDQEKPMIRLVKDRVWEVDGRLPLHELAELAGEPLQAPGISTASGWVTHRLGGFPKQGDVIQLSRCELRVLSVLGHRADTLLITQFPTQELGGTSKEKK